MASCDGLSLLDTLFGTVIVPEAVYREAIVGDKPQARKLKDYLHDKARKIDSLDSVLLDGFSDLGETEAMLLYRQYSADKLLIDDKRRRRVAKINQISTIGSLGVLLAAKRVGAIDRIFPFVNKLLSSDLYLSADLVATVMDIAGEEWPG